MRKKGTETKKILIADDDKFIRNQFEALIAELGYEPVTVNSAVKALAGIKDENIVVVITDVYMEGMKGDELLARIKEEKEEMPVLVITGDDSIETERFIREIGAFAYFVKPLEKEMIKRTIEAAVVFALSKKGGRCG
ncbi:MAG: response regulator [Candidatus Goldiibacteriota bacterium]